MCQGTRQTPKTTDTETAENHTGERDDPIDMCLLHQRGFDSRALLLHHKQLTHWRKSDSWRQETGVLQQSCFIQLGRYDPQLSLAGLCFAKQLHWSLAILFFINLMITMQLVYNYTTTSTIMLYIEITYWNTWAAWQQAWFIRIQSCILC